MGIGPSMVQFGFLLPEELSKQFDLFAASRGGRSAALRMLVAKAIEAEGALPAPSPSCRDNQVAGEKIAIRLSAEDIVRLDEECDSMGLSRGQWLQSCVRHRLRGSRHFGPVDRVRLAKIVSELRHMKTILFRCAGTLERKREDKSVLESTLAVVTRLSTDVARAIGSIEAALKGNDRYWLPRESPRDLAHAPRVAESEAISARDRQMGPPL